MKKLLAVCIAMLLVFVMSSVAFAATKTDIYAPHETTQMADEVVSEAVARVTIQGVKYPGQEGVTLPSEYHIRVIWNVTDGTYNATMTEADAEQNFGWNCNNLKYYVKRLSDEAIAALEENNWLNGARPAVSFEVTNASTPDLSVTVTPAWDAQGAWISKSLCAITCDKTGEIVLPPVASDMIGTGNNGRARNLGNVLSGKYTFVWDYENLNALALSLLGGQVTYEQRFTVNVKK